MSNIRIMYENQAKRSSITADTTAGSLVAANLLNDIKTSVYRSVGLAFQLNLQWTSLVTFNMMVLAFCNLTSTATIRVRIYTNTADAIGSPVLDTGVVLANAYVPLGQFDWGTTPIGVNAFRISGGSYACAYFNATNGRKVIVDIADAANAAGYLEAGCVVTGQYWSPETNPEYGAQLDVMYGAKHEESEAGDLRTERRPKRRRLDLRLEWLKSSTDQLRMHEIMMSGMESPMFVSLFPGDTDPVREQRHQMYCKLEGDTSMAHPKFGQFTAPLTVLEI